MKQKRYKPVKNYKGIRQDLKSGKFVVQKSINGKRYSKTFKKKSEAINWSRTYCPVEEVESKKQETTFGEVWEMYVDMHLSTQQNSTRENRIELAKSFVDLFQFEIGRIDPSIISALITSKKKEVLKSGNTRRKSFDQELKLLKAVFNWYRELYDHTFSNPITRQHKILGKISNTTKKEKKLNYEELMLFFGELESTPFWYDFALAQFFCAGRVQEIAGLQKSSVDFKNRKLLIKDVVIWRKSDKKFDLLKPVPKNGEKRPVYINDLLFQALLRRMNNNLNKSSYVFSLDGNPLNYRQIQHHYDSALKRCGLSDRFSGTHILRHSMATLTRKVTGSLEATQAITGHKDQRLVQHYASMNQDANREAQIQIQNFLESKNFMSVSKCEQIH